MKSVFFAVAAVLAMSSLAIADLAAYWDFEDGGGFTASDSSGNGQHAELMSADGSHYPQWTTGPGGSGGALLFNTEAVSDPNKLNYLYVDPNDVPDDPNVLVLGDAFTISMWLRRDALTGDWAYLAYTDAYDVELALDPDGSGNHPYDYLYSEANTAWRYQIGLETEDQKTPGNWYHLAVTCDNQILRKYVNGVLEYSVYVPPDINLPRATTALYIASRLDSGGVFTGALDDIAIWAGTYLPAAEVAKLANQTATPLTVTDEPSLEPITWVLESQIVTSGWKALWNQSMFTDLQIGPIPPGSGWAQATLDYPDDRAGVVPWHWVIRNEGDYSTVDNTGASRYGVEWINPAWSGYGHTIAKIAVYLTPGLVFGQYDKGYQPCLTNGYPWENKPYFKTYARLAGVNAQGAKFRIKTYSYPAGGPKPYEDPNAATFLGQTTVPIYANDYEWQEFKYAVPKPVDVLDTDTRVWFEASIVNGNPDTIVYIDELNPVSDQTVTFSDADFDHDSIVYMPDFEFLIGEWLDNGSVQEPRDSGMLANGDFYADLNLLNPLEEEPAVTVDPTGWTFTGSGTGAHGIHYMTDRGFINSFFSGSVMIKTPLGGSVAAYTKDPDLSLEQTTTTTAVNGQTYYAMGYVMTRGYIYGFDDWAGHNDLATLSLEIEGTEVAVFERPLSRERWRPVYGTYTAAAADAGKPITIRFSYDNTATPPGWPDPGYMYLGYAYLGDTVPEEWPEERDNLLVNGGFEDLSVIEGTPVYDSITSSDNGGTWFPNPDVPVVLAPPGWLYEVSAGFFNDPNVAGIRASAFHGSPLPTSGLHDVTMYTSEGLTLGQVVGALTSGTTYYLDMACGVCIEPTWWGSFSQTWPTPAPSLHLELWQIPAGVTDGAVIYAAIAGGNPDYVKIAEAYADSTGDIKGGAGGAVPPASRWQLIGTAYTATAADTNVYIRVYGADEVADAQIVHPTFAFSDVYLSTEKRLVPGGDITFEIASGMQYDIGGPYTCYHGGLMGAETPAGDLNGDCMVDLWDFALLAKEWIALAF